MTLCEENCDFNEYDKKTKKAKCKCDIKNFTESSEINFDMQSFYKYCSNFTTLSNINVMKCYKNLFAKNGILNNYGSFIILPIVFFHIISYIIFNLRDLNLIRNKIREIVHFRKVFDSLNKKKNKDNINEIEQNADNKENKEINYDNKNFIIKRKTILLQDNLSISIGKKEVNNEKEKNKEINNGLNSPIRKKNGGRTEKKYSIHLIKTSDIISNNSSKSINFSQNEKNKEKNISFLNNNFESKQNIPYIAYNNSEMNNLLYEEALKFDKRNYFQYYLSLIETKHILLFVFYTKDYNLMLIKINLFLFFFASYFAVNGLFFDDRTMHKIYTEGGKYNFMYQIPKILYSSLISTVINTIIRHFSLSQENILELKKEKLINIDEKAFNIEKCLIFKFALFFKMSFIFLLLFWYYISCFCVVYKNTQLQLIKDILIGFALCLIYPLGLYLIPGIFRIPSLKASKKNMKHLYKFSIMLQLIV